MKKLEIVGLVSLVSIFSYAAGYSKAREKFLEAMATSCADSNVRLQKEVEEAKSKLDRNLDDLIKEVKKES